MQSFLPPFPPCMIVAAMVDKTRIIVANYGFVMLSQLGNSFVPIGNTPMKFSYLMTMYLITMDDIAAMLEILQMASVQGDLGTTRFVPHNPSIPTWAEQKRVRAEQKQAMADQKRMALESAAASTANCVMALKKVLDTTPIGDYGVLASRFGSSQEVKAIIRGSMPLKDLIANIPKDSTGVMYCMMLATEGNHGSATIYKLAAREA